MDGGGIWLDKFGSVTCSLGVRFNRFGSVNFSEGRGGSGFGLIGAVWPNLVPGEFGSIGSLRAPFHDKISLRWPQPQVLSDELSGGD